MKVYLITTTQAENYPETAAPMITTDRALAASTWRDWAIEESTEEDIEHIEELAMDFSIDDETKALHWVVGNDGPIEEMVTYQVLTAELANVRPIILRGGRIL